MRKAALSALSTFALLASPAIAAGPDKPDQSEKPVTQQEPNAVDVVTTPASDLNIKKENIPTLLVAAQEQPYALSGLGTCRQLAGAILELNIVLGEDIDMPQSDGKRLSPGRVAQSVVGAFIPFRGVIREISGANNHDRAMQSAILAGVARRSFLKGIGQGKGCRYPARSATLAVLNQREAELNAGKESKVRAEKAEPTRGRRESRSEPSAARYVSRPVVQPAAD